MLATLQRRPLAGLYLRGGLFFSLFHYPQVSVELNRPCSGSNPLNLNDLPVGERGVFIPVAHSDNQRSRARPLVTTGVVEFFDKIANFEFRHFALAPNW